MLLIAYAVDISDGATMRNNEAIINESRLAVVRAAQERCFSEFLIKLSRAVVA